MVRTSRLIGIAGPSCSGKTLLAEMLRSRLAEKGAVVLPLDAYYLDLGHLSPEEIGTYNFDSPESLDATLLIRQVDALARGEEIARPAYDYASHQRSRIFVQVRPGGNIIVEGLYALYFPEIADRCALRIFMELDDRECLERRKVRDEKERGATREFTLWQYEHHVRPMYEKYIEPTRTRAHLVLRGDTPVETSVDQILRQLRASERE